MIEPRLLARLDKKEAQLTHSGRCRLRLYAVWMSN